MTGTDASGAGVCVCVCVCVRARACLLEVGLGAQLLGQHDLERAELHQLQVLARVRGREVVGVSSCEMGEGGTEKGGREGRKGNQSDWASKGL